MRETKKRKLVQGYYKRIIVFENVIESDYDTEYFDNVWLIENGQVQQIKTYSDRLVDCVMLYNTENNINILNYLEKLSQAINVFGQIIIVFDHGTSSNYSKSEWECFLSHSKWILYYYGQLDTGSSDQYASGMVLVTDKYNPIAHARYTLEQSEPWFAITLLDEIPAKFTHNNGDLSLLAMLSMERQRYYLKWQELCKGEIPDHTFFTLERSEFGLVTALFPDCSESYRLHSRFWSRLNRDDMAIRILKSIEYVSPDPKTRHLLQILEQNYKPDVESCTVTYSPTDLKHHHTLPRILIICHDYSDYGLDTLYHGLCSILGKDKVVEFPWKPTLHGCDPHKTCQYPCFFNYPGEAVSVDNLVNQLKSGCFDLILYADVIKMEHQNEVRRLVDADPDIPLVLYDSWDNCYTPLDLLYDYIGGKEFNQIFKRELLQGVKYDRDPMPLPFSYPEMFCGTHKPVFTGNKASVFWAGKREYGLRPLYLRKLESLTGQALDVRYDQESYRQRLRTSLIGLSFFGYGFDTVRYWELPANGVMLFAERPPIHIPNNFVDGESAIFFDTIADMEEKLEYYICNPEAARQIATKGREHYLKHHTTTARALTFLGAVCAKFEFTRRTSDSLEIT